MKKPLTERQKMERRFKTLTHIVESSSAQQQRMRPTVNGYSAIQHEQYAQYQSLIDRANEELVELKRKAAAMVV